MKLSVLDLVPILAGTTSTTALEQALTLAQTAERLGYYRYWTAEHHDMEGLACTSPEVLLAHIGARTERIRLGSGALLLPHYKPIKVAESFNLLASLYPGRIDLGMGRAPGGSAHVSMALSGNFLENVRLLPESLKSISELMQGTYEYEGTKVNARPSPAVPPELWLLGTNNRSAAYAAEFGMGYVFGQFMSDSAGEEVLRDYRRAFMPSPLCAEPKTIVAIGVICADTVEEANELAATWALFRNAGQTKTKDSSSSVSPLERQVLVGTAEGIHAKLVQLSALYEVDEFLLVTMIPNYEKRLRSYELMASAR